MKRIINISVNKNNQAFFGPRFYEYYLDIELLLFRHLIPIERYRHASLDPNPNHFHLPRDTDLIDRLIISDIGNLKSVLGFSKVIHRHAAKLLENDFNNRLLNSQYSEWKYENSFVVPHSVIDFYERMIGVNTTFVTPELHIPIESSKYQASYIVVLDGKDYLGSTWSYVSNGSHLANSVNSANSSNVANSSHLVDSFNVANSVNSASSPHLANNTNNINSVNSVNSGNSSDRYSRYCVISGFKNSVMNAISENPKWKYIAKYLLYAVAQFAKSHGRDLIVISEPPEPISKVLQQLNFAQYSNQTSNMDQDVVNFLSITYISVRPIDNYYMGNISLIPNLNIDIENY